MGEHYIFWCTHDVLIRTLSLFGANICFFDFGRKCHYLRPTFYLFLHEFNLYCASIFLFGARIIFILCAYYFNWVCFVHTSYLFAWTLDI